MNTGPGQLVLDWKFSGNAEKILKLNSTRNKGENIMIDKLDFTLKNYYFSFFFIFTLNIIGLVNKLNQT